MNIIEDINNSINYYKKVIHETSSEQTKKDCKHQMKLLELKKQFYILKERNIKG